MEVNFYKYNKKEKIFVIFSKQVTVSCLNQNVVENNFRSINSMFMRIMLHAPTQNLTISLVTLPNFKL